MDFRQDGRGFGPPMQFEHHGGQGWHWIVPLLFLLLFAAFAA
jgi:hypothetical protein